MEQALQLGLRYAPCCVCEPDDEERGCGLPFCSWISSGRPRAGHGRARTACGINLHQNGFCLIHILHAVGLDMQAGFRIRNESRCQDQECKQASGSETQAGNKIRHASRHEHQKRKQATRSDMQAGMSIRNASRGIRMENASWLKDQKRKQASGLEKLAGMRIGIASKHERQKGEQA